MKNRRKKIQPQSITFIRKANRVPESTKYEGLKQLFRDNGLIDQNDQPTPKGREAIAG